MPRTTIAAVETGGGYNYDGIVCTGTAADTSNQNQTPCTGREIIVARNSGASGRTVTVTGAATRGTNRTASISADSIAAGVSQVYGPFPVDGWRQADGMLYFEANNAEVLFTVLRLPSAQFGT